MAQKLSKKGIDKFEDAREYEYLLYDNDNRRVNNQASIEHVIVLDRGKKDDDLIVVNYSWKVMRNGEVISKNERSKMVDLSSDEKDKNVTLLYQDDMHFYYLKSYIHKYAAEFEIVAAYKSYFKHTIKE